MNKPDTENIPYLFLDEDDFEVTLVYHNSRPNRSNISTTKACPQVKKPLQLGPPTLPKAASYDPDATKIIPAETLRKLLSLMEETAWEN